MNKYLSFLFVLFFGVLIITIPSFLGIVIGIPISTVLCIVLTLLSRKYLNENFQGASASIIFLFCIFLFNFMGNVFL